MIQFSLKTQALAADAQIAHVHEALGGHGSAIVDTTGELIDLLARMPADTVVRVKDEERRPVGADLGDGQDWRFVTVVSAGAALEPIDADGVRHTTGAVYLGTSWIPGPDAPLPEDDEPIVCACKQIGEHMEFGDLETAATALGQVLTDFTRLIGPGSAFQRDADNDDGSNRLDLDLLAKTITTTGELLKAVAGRVQERYDNPEPDEEQLNELESIRRETEDDDEEED